VWNRTRERAEHLAAQLGAAVRDADGGILGLGDVDLLVNCTSVGLSGAPARAGDHLKALGIAADAITERHTVVDMVYGLAETELAAAARQRGARVVDGLEVLVHQGAASFRIWTGEDPPVETMRKAARR
jgi:shikimate dehydrogenase